MIVEVILFTIVLVLLYIHSMSRYDFWDKHGVPVDKPKYPLFGNSFNTLFSLKAPGESQYELYMKFPNERFFGKFHFMKPNLVLRDPHLVETLTIKDFAVASDRGIRDDPRANKLAMHLLNLTDAHWKSLRNKLTPIFSPSKLKGMLNQLVECAESLNRTLTTYQTNRCPFDAREIVSRFTTDVIASCTFGLNIDTLNDPNSMFRSVGKAAFEDTSTRKIILSLKRVIGPLGKFLKAPGGITNEMLNFFINIVDETIAFRKKQAIVRHDFLHLMNELLEKDQTSIKNGELDSDNPYIFDHTALVSNAFVFFVAGFETTASTISYAMYELCLNPIVQDRVFQEVVGVTNRHDGKVTYEALQEMTYMDQVISETLRRYPPIPGVSRVLTQEYKVPHTDLVLPKGFLITIPIYAIHHDPQYFENPFEFNPERFSDNGTNIKKGTYLPFGSGPRICIGARFAILEVKVALAKMLLNFEIVKCSKTKDPLIYDKTSRLHVPEGGIWLAVQARDKRYESS
ncbi:cytochrome P450 [Nesidiocoris tenuis]|uniref:Cytochrome P450 n=1 Tax=Nesidiocoris tenuis TaxID=355587 RepID=A0ABN7A5E8_9HEMI|nr:cytochrome P450 [Nesidiocoris tenuis]